MNPVYQALDYLPSWAAVRVRAGRRPGDNWDSVRVHLMMAYIAALGACTNQPAMLDRVTACQEQADAWCTQVGPDTYGCRAVWVELDCARVDRDRPIAEDQQEACLLAISEAPRSLRQVPDACMRTWATVPGWSQ